MLALLHTRVLEIFVALFLSRYHTQVYHVRLDKHDTYLLSVSIGVQHILEICVHARSRGNNFSREFLLQTCKFYESQGWNQGELESSHEREIMLFIGKPTGRSRMNFEI
jgi:hypothetical protein